MNMLLINLKSHLIANQTRAKQTRRVVSAALNKELEKQNTHNRTKSELISRVKLYKNREYKPKFMNRTRTSHV